ncbi:MAG: glucosamine-6-phosphate deaminase [Tidjanibacter sp.]|nr:glucosamine-6-phosphate deaminase [Tidjanibacter sp.]
MKLKITIAASEEVFDRVAADRILSEMKSNPTACIGFSTGQTTKNMHALVAADYAAQPFKTDTLTLFNVDELTNLPRSYDGCCYTMIKAQVCDPLNVPEENFIMPQTISDDYERECREFVDELERRGGIDLQILGLGTNGHIGINQPGTPFGSRVWVSPMDPIFEARVRRETGVPDDHYLGGLTLGIADIMHSRRIVLVAKGTHKAEMVRGMIEGPVTEDLPASVLQLHPNCEFLIDRDAASLLSPETLATATYIE